MYQVGINKGSFYIFWVCICSLRYSACSAHAPNCHLWPAQVYIIFPHYVINGMICKIKKLFNIKCVCFFFIFSTTFFRNISRSKKKWARYDQKCILVFMQSHRYSCLILNFLDSFQKILKYQISWKTVKWEPSCSTQTDRQTRWSWYFIFTIFQMHLKILN